MYDRDQLMADATSKTVGGGIRAADRHLHNRPGAWQDLAAQAAALGLRLDGLPDKEAEARRRKLAGQTAAEIGAALGGISRRAVRRLLSRARALVA